jgi:hypothetical protein
MNRREDLIHLLLFSCPLLGFVWFRVFIPQDTACTDALPRVGESFPFHPPYPLWTHINWQQKECECKTGKAFTLVPVIMGTSEQTSYPLCPHGLNEDHLSTQAYLKHIPLRKGSLLVISLTCHCCPDLILFCFALDTIAYFPLLNKCYSFIIEDEVALGEGNYTIWPVHIESVVKGRT